MLRDVSLADVRAAADRLRGQLAPTPCLASRTLSEISGAEVFLKFENLQFTASFKERGALAKLLSLGPEERARGVLAVSAGNHAQAVAHHARRLGIAATIVMPRLTPGAKIERTAFHGPEILLEGEDFEAARQRALEIARQRGLVLLHPYDDPVVVAGQGTVALETLAAAPDLEVLLVPAGGGGLAAGSAVAAKALRPDLRVVAVQARRFPSLWNALRGESLPFGPASVADGVAVKVPGELTRELVGRLVDDILLVDEEEIERAVLLLLEVEKTVVEGAGALGLAALLANRERFAGRRVGLVLSGGNIDPQMLAEILQRGLARSGRLVRLRVELRDVPGSLAAVTAVLAQADANVEEVRHQRTFTHLPAQNAEVEFVVRTRGPAHAGEVLRALAARGFRAERVEG
jgi:threonine dehydratase